MGVGGSVIDQGCDVWRDSQNLIALGYTEAAQMRLCDKPEIASLLPFCETPAPSASNAPDEAVAYNGGSALF
jgi:hypothetical protein